jgi:hypothetical protein
MDELDENIILQRFVLYHNSTAGNNDIYSPRHEQFQTILTDTIKLKQINEQLLSIISDQDIDLNTLEEKTELIKTDTLESESQLVLADKYNSKYMLSMMGGALGILANITFSLPLTISIISGSLLGAYISKKL